MAKIPNTLGNNIGFRIIRYSKKDNLDGDSFLQTAFEEWFCDQKENSIQNYSMQSKDSLVLKDGVDADLMNLRKMVVKNENIV